MKIEIGDPIVNVLVKMVLDQFKQFDRQRNFDDKYNELLGNNLDFALEYEELLEHTVFGYVLDIIGIPEDESYPHLFPKDDELMFDDDGHPHFSGDLPGYDFESPEGFCRDWFYDKLFDIGIKQKSEDEREKFAIMTTNEIIEAVWNEIQENGSATKKQMKESVGSDWYEESDGRLKKFLNQNPDATFYVFEYSDNDGALFSAMEHGTLFRRVKHIKTSRH